jgi:hypothetical protein
MTELVFQDVIKARNSITLQQRREIKSLYLQWASQIDEEAERYARKVTATAPISTQQMRDLNAMLVEASDRIADSVEGIATSSMMHMSEVVVSSNTKWLISLGFAEGVVLASMNAVPDAIVQRIVTGQIYESGWSLSNAIWSDKMATQRQAYEIVAGGLAKNESVYKIAKNLEQWVNPEKAKPWNLVMADGRRLYPRSVDYNAQRLARTLTQHAYQQTLLDNSNRNDLVIGWRWVANGSRACPLCLERDGMFIPKEDGLPLDHPNGMCIFPVVLADDWLFQLRDRLAA